MTKGNVERYERQQPAVIVLAGVEYVPRDEALKGDTLALDVVPASELAGAVEALLHFGGHFEACSSCVGPHPCDCGWTETLGRFGGQ